MSLVPGRRDWFSPSLISSALSPKSGWFSIRWSGQTEPIPRARRSESQTVPNDFQQVVQKLWNYCNVLRDDGLSYGH